MFSALSIFSGPYALLARWAILAIACAALYFAGYVKGHHSAELDFERFKGGVESLAKQAEERTKTRIATDKLNAEVTNANHSKALTSIAADLDRLRKRNAGSSVLPTFSAAPASVNGTCFDSAKLDTALRNLDAGILGIVESGAKAVIALDAAKGWALKMSVEMR